jgi:hypothetical protein
VVIFVAEEVSGRKESGLAWHQWFWGSDGGGISVVKVCEVNHQSEGGQLCWETRRNSRKWWVVAKAAK